MPLTQLRIAQIRRDHGNLGRGDTDQANVERLLEVLRSGGEFLDEEGRKVFPVVFKDEAGVYWLSHGFHRVEAHERRGDKTVTCNVQPGGLRDAILHAIGTNARHGLQRTPEHKRYAVATLLRDEEWGKWNDTEIAKRCAVGRAMVANVRAIMRDEHDRKRLVKRGGTTYEQAVRRPKLKPMEALAAMNPKEQLEYLKAAETMIVCPTCCGAKECPTCQGFGSIRQGEAG